MKIIFKCQTCDYYNRMELGCKNFIERRIEFDSLTEAYMHLHATRKDRNSNVHEMTVEIVND